ncbi:MAG: DUF4097 family beta strand repeat-containing protein [Bifidobacterium subtile]|jgi:hypothetical protein|uniref:DUF4097 family beta strand repeat-containing protein n=1 Tax=Bifidobacterium tibiigranuli TaxID=2172043 RepID=UPI002357CE6F|nr:DUF4097 family beta strand repeat-containing protein [Bifidobacterium tibiigranuli]MCI1258984.1 DUF4097 family beta strand repeat-containing protein [Bifidobacterium subtile]MCH3975904.1 DUF4097 family beta strand repeat-containing protein [Bifidobacterium tibiigranuli]MCH4190194.1 DUF4097 family beta strand repeat-containing protein [Bifidobacterium tibiigranuli]MCH4204381.1 DUF4097 family beta strand repeat-containing protein [Bifidobacterium tibiigranuli]MCH4275098.1 DUF4097 family beta 
MSAIPDDTTPNDIHANANGAGPSGEAANSTASNSASLNDAVRTFALDSQCTGISILLHQVGATIHAGDEDDKLTVYFRHCSPADFRISRDAESFTIENIASPWERFDPARWWRFPHLDITVPARERLHSLRLEADHAGLIVKNVAAQKLSLQIGGGSCALNRVTAGESSVRIDSGSIRWHGRLGNITLDCDNGSATIHGMPSEFGYDAQLRNGSIRFGSHHLHGGIVADSKPGTPHATVICNDGTVEIR